MSRNVFGDLTKTKFRQASSSAITSRTTRAKDYARLYFRPDTNTQWVCQGIKSVEELERDDAGAHCPLMVMMLFDSRDVLTLEDDPRIEAWRSTPRASSTPPVPVRFRSTTKHSERRNQGAKTVRSPVSGHRLDSLVAVIAKCASRSLYASSFVRKHIWRQGDDSGVSMWTQRRLFLESVYADSTGRAALLRWRQSNRLVRV